MVATFTIIQSEIKRTNYFLLLEKYVNLLKELFYVVF
jgi:hypothetical protein